MGLIEMGIKKLMSTSLRAAKEMHPLESAVDDGERPLTDEPELITTLQYGLRMPNGEIVWNVWNEPPLVIPFDNPLDRLRMVANLQKTAADVGFEVDQFLSHYGWVTRRQIATVIYEDTGAYPLTDPDVCGATSSQGHCDDRQTPTPDTEGASDSEDTHHSDRAVRPGHLGGDAQ